jgi:YD repeat-containing protein
MEIMLKKTFVRDGNNQAMGAITSGFANGGTVARDTSGKIIGRASETFQSTRDAQGRLISTNVADTKLVLRK